jgi:tetratricopeptide (TPR) repeat protein
MDASRGENRRAEELLLRATEIDPNFALAQAALGECYALRTMRWWGGPEMADLAMPRADRALELEPDLFEAHFVRAMVYRIKGQSEELLIALERVTAMNPDHPQAAEWAAWSYMSLSKPAKAVPILERLAERHPDNYIPISYLSGCYEMLGMKAEAEQAARRSLECEVEFVRRHPDDALARLFLGISLVKANEIAAGVAQVERGVGMAHDDGRIRYNAACAYARAGMPEQAIRELKEGTRRLASFISDWPARDPDLASLREHPDYIALFGRVELDPS